MKRWSLPVAAALGVALFGWTIWSVGPRELVSQMRALASVLPLILVLAGVRFWFQAAGWRLAMPEAQRPLWRDVFTAVVAGEAAGYFAWGPVTREPMKAMLIAGGADRIPQRAALAAAVFERFVYTISAAALIAIGAAIAAVRFHFVGWFLFGLAVTIAVAFAAGSYWQRVGGDLRRHRSSLAAMMALGAAQEVSNLVEAYLVLAWLGATPTLTAIVVLEGLSRLLNGAGQFIPGKLGVTEAATTALAEGLRLGGAHGLSLALARRVRSLAWGALGIAFVTFRALNWQDMKNVAIRYLRPGGARLDLPARGLLH